MIHSRVFFKNSEKEVWKFYGEFEYDFWEIKEVKFGEAIEEEW